MPSLPLPEDASLEHLKRQAKLVQNLVKDRDRGALDMIDEFHPRLSAAEIDPSKFKRSDAQLMLARLYGFAGWNALRDHLSRLADFARPDPADHDHEEAAERFASLGCVSYAETDVVGRLRQAEQMLEEQSGLAAASIAAMATSGNHRRLAEELEADPAVADRACGPHGWSPLLYCAYSRIDAVDPQLSTLAAAKVLLEAGADPNAGFLWRGLVPPFTALTGAIGHGEQDQPRHPDWQALARLLLEAGADPNDGQALYNNGLAGSAIDDPTYLELLVQFGLGLDTTGPWYARFGPKLSEPARLLSDELEVAASRGLPNRLRFLVGLGIELDQPVGRSRQRPAEIARRAGHDEVVAILAEQGITP